MFHPLMLPEYVADVLCFHAYCSFLDSLDRVAQPRYVPTDGESNPYPHNNSLIPTLNRDPPTDDILRARLKTLGVTEYRFNIKEGMLDVLGMSFSCPEQPSHSQSRGWG